MAASIGNNSITMSTNNNNNNNITNNATNTNSFDFKSNGVILDLKKNNEKIFLNGVKLLLPKVSNFFFFHSGKIKNIAKNLKIFIYLKIIK